MGRGYRLVLLAVLALGISSQAAAASPQLYVASGDGYSVALKVEDANTYVLGLDATVYCSETEPQSGDKPSLQGFFATPTPMREGKKGGLTASQGDGGVFGSNVATVNAVPEGGKLVGHFQYVFSVLSSHCQTGGYFGNRPDVAFEAVPYAPVDGLTPSPPFAAAASAVYYGTEGALETFFTVFRSVFGLRGTVASACLATTKKPPPRIGALASEVLIAKFAEGGAFHQKLRSLGRGGLTAIHEAITLDGTVGDEAITGTYFDRIGTRLGKKPKRICHTGPLPFHAVRYLPSAVPYGALSAIRNS